MAAGGMTGMNIGEVTALSSLFRSSSQELDQIVSKLESKLHGTTWVGADQQRFVGDWNSQHKTALKNAAQALLAAADRTKLDAEEQQRASA